MFCVILSMRTTHNRTEGRKLSLDLILGLAVAAVLGLIPANIAKKKGHSFGLWWFYGWMLFIVAIIHVQFIEDYNQTNTMQSYAHMNGSTADEIRKYKELSEQGIITEEEFRKKKDQLLQN